jgi:hypothetical protein
MAAETDIDAPVPFIFYNHFKRLKANFVPRGRNLIYPRVFLLAAGVFSGASKQIGDAPSNDVTDGPESV